MFPLKHQYQQTSSDHSLFIKANYSSIIILLMYVNDVILAGNDLNEFTSIKIDFDNGFEIMNLGKLKYLIGTYVAYPKEKILIFQRNYCLDLLEVSGFIEFKSVSAPSDTVIKLHQDSSAQYSYVPAYRRLVEILLYMNSKRPDITFCTQKLS